MKDVPPFGVRAFLLMSALPFGFEFLLTPEDFAMWIILWAGYMVLFAGVNAWRARVALGLVAPTASFAAVGFTDPFVVGSSLLGAWIVVVLLNVSVQVIKNVQRARNRVTSRRRDTAQLVAIAAKPRSTDVSVADVLAHFGLESGGEQ